MKRLFLGLLALLVTTNILPMAPNHAFLIQDDRMIMELTPAFSEALLESTAALLQQDQKKAQTALNTARALPSLNKTEQALLYVMEAHLAGIQEDTERVISSFKQVLTSRQYIDLQTENLALHLLTQTLFAQNDFEQATKYASEWETLSAQYFGPVEYELFARIHYARRDYLLVSHYLQETIESAKRSNFWPVKNNWYLRLATAQQELEQYSAAVDTILVLIEEDPRQNETLYCPLLAGFIQERDDIDEQTAITRTASSYIECASLKSLLTVASDIGAIRTVPGQTHRVNSFRSEEEVLTPLKRVTPRYPHNANSAGIEGYTVLSVDILPNGKVDPRSIRVLESSPLGYFEQSAIDAVRQFTYPPFDPSNEKRKTKGIHYRFTFALSQ